ncbi:adenylosuccinate lyase [candidate division WOR-3 bacterium]|nr:adenylosuccinate lyase [candidate division WOR-3 bacterium]
MIERYTTEAMKEIWSYETKFNKWLSVELAVLEGWVKRGDVKKDVLERVKKKAAFNVKRIEKIEKRVKHDVIAFLTNLSENIGDDARFIHMGMTSSDILDTAFALLLREAGEHILKKLKNLKRILRQLSKRYKKTVMMGRTHGVHAEPITLGLKFLLWYDEVERNIGRLSDAIENISYAKISGSVGTFSTMPPDVFEYAARKLKLKPCYATSQIISRDHHAQYLFALALIASLIEKIALEIRHLQRTEVGEVMEPFTKGQKGSSAMPHKRNPILCERLCGMSRLVRSHVIVALENIALWHERDISHSSCERIIFPDSTTLIDYSLEKLLFILKNLTVDEKRLKRNIDMTKGLIFSQSILLKLIEKGMSREDAYKIVQSDAMKVWKDEKDFLTVLLGDKKIKKLLTRNELESCFDINYYLKNIEYIYKKVLG